MSNKVLLDEIRSNINSIIVGKKEVVDMALVCLLADGHLLIEDVPGVGKTTLAKAIANTLGMKFGRIQFTPDTLPSDIMGMSVYNMKTSEFEFRQGVVMNELILADEINRTPPKTQASLLEAMAEKQVTVDGQVYQLPKQFMVIATQNPAEYLGTYPLPEAQLDRFMMRISIGYPSDSDELDMARKELAKVIDGYKDNGDVDITRDSNVSKNDDVLNNRTDFVDNAKDITSIDIGRMKAEVANVTVKDNVLSYIEEIVGLTRKDNKISLGASPRAMLALTRASMAKAYLEGRDYVLPDDVKAVTINVLAHRLVLSPEARMRQEDVTGILKALILKVKVPV